MYLCVCLCVCVRGCVFACARVGLCDGRPCFAILESQMTRDNSRQEFMKDEVLIVPLIQNALSVMLLHVCIC